jgi:hypothetical protein
MTKIKHKSSILEQYHAFLKGYGEKGGRPKNPYEKGTELHFFYLIGRKHKGEVDSPSSKRIQRYSEH